MNVSGASSATINDYTKNTHTTKKENIEILFDDCGKITINNNFYDNTNYIEVFSYAFQQGFEMALRLLENNK